MKLSEVEQHEQNSTNRNCLITKNLKVHWVYGANSQDPHEKKTRKYCKYMKRKSMKTYNSINGTYRIRQSEYIAVMVASTASELHSIFYWMRKKTTNRQVTVILWTPRTYSIQHTQCINSSSIQSNCQNKRKQKWEIIHMPCHSIEHCTIFKSITWFFSSPLASACVWLSIFFFSVHFICPMDGSGFWFGTLR